MKIRKWLFLKAPGTKGTSFSGKTRVEKIVRKYVSGLKEGELVRQGDYVKIKPQHVMTHVKTSSVVKNFKEICANKVYISQFDIHTTIKSMSSCRLTCVVFKIKSACLNRCNAVNIICKFKKKGIIFTDEEEYRKLPS